MKVSKAKKKICPFMSGVVQSEMFHTELTEVCCVGGDCMAWKYTKTHNADGQGNDTHKLDEDDKEGYCKKLK